MPALSTISEISSVMGNQYNIFATQSHYVHRLLFITFLIIVSEYLTFAQQGSDSMTTAPGYSLVQQDSLITRDSLVQSGAMDFVSGIQQTGTGWIISPGDPFFQQKLSWHLLQRHPYFGFSSLPFSPRFITRKVIGKEFLFYLLVFLLLMFGLFRRAFPKYFRDLFRHFFRASLNQRQVSEQLMESSLPSLLLNIFFVISGGLYISFLLQHFRAIPASDFWRTFFFCMLALSGIYLIKYLGLRFSGWLFSMREAIGSYIFIVYTINKMTGIFLIPFLILLGFPSTGLSSASLVISWIMLAGMLAYRIILTFAAVRNQVKVNPFHFFLYVCAFELVPLLLIYKGLLLYFRISA